MVSESLLDMLGPILIGTIVAVVGILIERSLSKIDKRLKEIENELEEEKELRKQQHDVLIGWLANMTNKVQDEGIDIERPDEIQDSVEIEGD